MGRKALTTYSMVGLKIEAGKKNLKWASIAIELSSKLNMLPGNFAVFAQAAITELTVNRHWWEAKISSILSVKVADKVAIDDYSSSSKVKRLLIAQVVLGCEDIELAEEKLGYDRIRHNYAWAGRLFEIGDSVDRVDGDTFCVIHPDEDFKPSHQLGVAYVIRSCTQADPDFGNIGQY